jgi:hypothetical protein
MKPVELLRDDCDFVPAATKALEEIFSRYDKDGDKALNPAELKACFLGCNGEAPNATSLKELRNTFHHNDKGHFTLVGFLDMYNLQTNSDEDETWKDLRKHGYDDQLLLKPATTSSSSISTSSSSTTTDSTPPSTFVPSSAESSS